MYRRLLTTIALLVIAISLFAAPTASAAQPWWQILDGSRPSRLWKPSDSVQEITVTMGEIPESELGEGSFHKLEVAGKPVACLHSETFLGNIGCAIFYGGESSEPLPPVANAEELETALEPVYGTPAVEVTGGPVAVAPLIVTVPSQGVPTIALNNEKEVPHAGIAKSKILAPGGSGRLTVTISNLGDGEANGKADPIRVVDELPEGVEASGIEAFAGNAVALQLPIDCELETSSKLSCTLEEKLPSYESMEIEVLVNLVGDHPVPGAPGKITVSGGGAPTTFASQLIEVSPDDVPFGIERFAARSEEEGGTDSSRAGGHPFQFTTTLQLNAGDFDPSSGRNEARVDQPALPRRIGFTLPAGFVGNTTVVPRCSAVDFFDGNTVVLANHCPDETAIGVARVTISEPASVGFGIMTVPIFNLVPVEGEPARFGFTVAGVPVLVDTEVDPDNGYRIVAVVRNVTQVSEFLSSTVTIWGTPGDPRHNPARGWTCGHSLKLGIECANHAGTNEDPFFRMPVSCTSPLNRAEAEPWNVPLGSVVGAADFASPPLQGCNQVPFDPSINAASTSKLASNASGLEFQLDMPNSGLLDQDAIAEGQAKKVEVTLPEGMTINPSQAEGLTVCSPADYARERYDSAPGDGCPNASKIGEVQVTTPLLKEEARGSLYVAKPYDNPSKSLIALYLVARIPERGILIKQAGKVEPDPKTGQLVTTFGDLPQLPFSSFKLRFREGGRAPLVTPPICGPQQVVAKFTPWSAGDPDNPLPGEIVTRTSTFTIDRGVDGGACPSGNPPFKPGFEAGSVNNAAGHYSPFYMRLTRADGDQDLTKFSAVLPEGALAKLKGVSQCPQAVVEAAKQKTGLDERANPSCPAASQIGTTKVGAGVGSILTYVPGQLYLGGPYHGSTLSVVSITPAVAGPFDVGTVVVQEGLKLDPATGEVHVDGNASDPIPHILAGIPLKVRDLRVYVDRDQFTTTPTSCDPMATKATLFGSGLDVFSPADDGPVDLSARYQAASCERLGFKPRVQIRLSGKRSTRGANPALRAVLRPRLGDANPDQIQVALPGSELLEQGHIRTICTRVQYAANGGNGGGCPKGSVYGHAKAWTPLLDEPLEGPVYLRSSNHELPDMVLALHGLVDIESVGRIDSVNERIRSTFENVPDAPLSKVVLSMQGGRKGLLVNSTDICRGVHRAKAVFTGQNGKRYTDAPKVSANCGEKKALKK